VIERLKKCIADTLGTDRDFDADGVDFDASDSFADDWGLDSLDFLFMIQGVEKEFGVEIPNETLVSLSTFGDLVDWLEARC
jgi:acyl carrier protein